MDPLKKILHLFKGRGAVIVLLVLILAGLAWERVDIQSPSRSFVRAVGGIYLGRKPAPGEIGITEHVKQIVAPSKSHRLMVVKHIPRISPGQPMPHPDAGPCKKCHLYRGGPGPGTQRKSVVGAALEKMSKVRKLGPPLVPHSVMPHPPAGRCIKCHDIVVKVPRKKGRQVWVR